jgi:hypothetical protein
MAYMTYSLDEVSNFSKKIVGNGNFVEESAKLINWPLVININFKFIYLGGTSH